MQASPAISTNRLGGRSLPVGALRGRTLSILITAKKRGWCGELGTIALTANGLAARGHQVVLAHNIGSEIVPRLDRSRVRLEEVDFQRDHGKLRTAARTIKHLRAIDAECQFDVLEAHASWDHWLSAIARRGMTNRPPLMRFRHNCKRILRHPPNRWLYERGTSGFATQTARVRDDILVTGYVEPEDVRIVGSALDLDRYKPGAPARAAVREELGIPANAPVVGYLGRLSARKRPGLLVDAFRHVVKEVPEARLVIVGFGERDFVAPLRKSLADEPQIIFAGRRNDPDRVFGAFDVFALPSVLESFPRAALEAMASGVPTVSGVDSGLQAFVTDGSTGRLVGDDSPAGYAAAITELLRDSALRARIAERGRELVERDLSDAAYIDRMEHLLRSLVSAAL